jgi:hypothetical protein
MYLTVSCPAALHVTQYGRAGRDGDGDGDGDLLLCHIQDVALDTRVERDIVTVVVTVSAAR